VVDYTHKLLGKEVISGRNCFKIELIPKENAPVVWGKILLWISQEEYLQLKAEYYDEDGYLVKTETGMNIKSMSGRVIPTRFELVPADKEGNKTILTLDMIEFNTPISVGFFTQQNMKKVR
jgi:outer membrane lipoprotein-sorting protein